MSHGRRITVLNLEDNISSAQLPIHRRPHVHLPSASQTPTIITSFTITSLTFSLFAILVVPILSVCLSVPLLLLYSVYLSVILHFCRCIIIFHLLFFLSLSRSTSPSVYLCIFGIRLAFVVIHLE